MPLLDFDPDNQIGTTWKSRLLIGFILGFLCGSVAGFVAGGIFAASVFGACIGLALGDVSVVLPQRYFALMVWFFFYFLRK